MKIGDKVVCLGIPEELKAQLNNHILYRGIIFPEKGEVYIIRNFNERYLGLRLVEIVNIPMLFVDGLSEVSFGTQHFRLLDKSFGEKVAERLEKDFVPLELVEVESSHFGE